MKTIKCMSAFTVFVLNLSIIQSAQKEIVISEKVQAVRDVEFYELYLLIQRGLPETAIEFVAIEADLKQQKKIKAFNAWFKLIYQEVDDESISEEIQQVEKKISRFRRLKNRLFS